MSNKTYYNFIIHFSSGQYFCNKDVTKNVGVFLDSVGFESGKNNDFLFEAVKNFVKPYLDSFYEDMANDIFNFDFAKECKYKTAKQFADDYGEIMSFAVNVNGEIDIIFGYRVSIKDNKLEIIMNYGEVKTVLINNYHLNKFVINCMSAGAK